MKKLSTILAVSVLASAVSISAQAATKHEQGGTLVVPVIAQTFTKDFNPLNGNQADLKRGHLYEPLWVFNTIKGEFNWRLAESFEYGDDKRSLTVKLKDGLTWSDGEKIDADDLVYNLKLGQADVKLDVSGQWANGVLKDVIKVDNLTARLEFNEVNTTVDWFIGDAIMMVPEHIFGKIPTEELQLFMNENPVGSGPMTQVKSATPSQVEFCRNPYYYKADQGLPYLDCIKYRAYSDNSQIQPALMNDEIDWGSNFIADIDKTYVEPSPDTHGYWYPANDVWVMYLNTRQAPFSDVNFRKAFSMAVDRDTMVDLATYGYATAEDTVVGIGKYFENFQNEEINKKFAHLAQFDPKEAASLLKKAGYKDVDGDGFLENPDGTKIDFEITIPAGWTDVVQVCQMTTEYLADIGIKSTVKLVDWSGYDSALKEGTYDVVFNWSATNGVDPIQAYREYYHPARVGQIWHAGHGMASEELGELVDEYMMIDDKARRTEILEELMVFTAENLPFVAIMSNATWFQYNTTRIDGFPTEENPYVRPVFYTNGLKAIILDNLYKK